MRLDDGNDRTVILGGGLAGLSAGYTLTQSDRKALVVEKDAAVGGLSKTIARGEFRFDLGGHRFFTKNKQVEYFVRDLMGGELLEVDRSSKICLRNKYFDYPLKPSNAVCGMGVATTARILCDYGVERIKGQFRSAENISLEDWVVSNFGRTMFDIYFKEYSEKVWGVKCGQISAEWVAKRIQGLSLGAAVKNAFFKFSGKGIPTLADKFVYPSLGIGRISERIQDEINKSGQVLTSTSVENLHRTGFWIEGLTVKSGDIVYNVEGDEFISSIPMTSLIRMIHPKVPRDVLEAASKLRYRDLVVVAVMLDRERATDQTWIYIPERKVPLGRIHEPKNWSYKMAPSDKTLLVAEFFCFEGDKIWESSDWQLTEITAHHLEKLGIVKAGEVIDSAVVRVPKAYPLLEVGYREYYGKVLDYLNKFENLHTIGRNGLFKYLNMDHAIDTGLDLAHRILVKGSVAKTSATKGSVARTARRERFAVAGDLR